MSGASLRWLAVARGRRSLAMLPFVVDVPPARLPEGAADLASSTPSTDIQGAGYQLHQSQIAVGSGGWFGKGLTNGTQNQG